MDFSDVADIAFDMPLLGDGSDVEDMPFDEPEVIKLIYIFLSWSSFYCLEYYFKGPGFNAVTADELNSIIKQLMSPTDCIKAYKRQLQMMKDKTVIIIFRASNE